MKWEGLSEFEIACRAKIGDKAAIKSLWHKYRNVLIGILGKCQYDCHLKECEAVLIFFHKLETFDPEKIDSPPEVWLFSHMLEVT